MFDWGLKGDRFIIFCFFYGLFQMEVEEEKQHEGIQQYYITKIEALQVSLHDYCCMLFTNFETCSRIV